jgi:hypothetical protein
VFAAHQGITVGLLAGSAQYTSIGCWVVVMGAGLAVCLKPDTLLQEPVAKFVIFAAITSKIRIKSTYFEKIDFAHRDITRAKIPATGFTSLVSSFCIGILPPGPYTHMIERILFLANDFCLPQYYQCFITLVMGQVGFYQFGLRHNIVIDKQKQVRLSLASPVGSCRGLSGILLEDPTQPMQAA